MSTQLQTAPNLEGRQARCQCGSLEPSSPALGFFEYRGIDSRAAQMHCKQCGYYEEAHTPERGPRNRHVCLSFRPHGAYEFDFYWCGCGGTD